MTNTTATVVTLTAEVRVLQVGNRQITLSVVNQLDRCRYEELEPMGRVHSSRRDMPGYTESDVEVVGRHLETGALVFAYAPDPRHSWPRGGDAWLHWSSHMMYSGHLQSDADYEGSDYEGAFDVARLRNGGLLSWPVSKRNLECPVTPYPPSNYSEVQLRDEWRERRNRGEFCDLNALRVEWQADLPQKLADWYAAEDIHLSAEALPLIVLAGLK